MASEWISILVDGQDMRAYLLEPETTGKPPDVIVIMEAFEVKWFQTYLLSETIWQAGEPKRHTCSWRGCVRDVHGASSGIDR